MDEKTRENAPDRLDFIELESESESNSNSQSDELETTTDQKGVVDRLQALIKTITEKEKHQYRKSSEAEQPPYKSVDAKQIRGEKHVGDREELEDPASSVAMALTIMEMEKDEADRCSGYDADVDTPSETRQLHPILAEIKPMHEASSSSVNTIGGDYEEINSWQVPIPNSYSESSDDGSRIITDPVSKYILDSCVESCDRDEDQDETRKKLRLE